MLSDSFYTSNFNKLAVTVFPWTAAECMQRLLTAAASDDHLNVHSCIFLDDLQRQIVTEVKSLNISMKRTNIPEPTLWPHVNDTWRALEPVWWLWPPQSQWSRQMSSPGWWSGRSWEVQERGPPPGLSCVCPPAGRSSAPPPRGCGTEPRGSLPAPYTGTNQRNEFFKMKIQQVWRYSFFFSISLLLQVNYSIHGLDGINAVIRISHKIQLLPFRASEAWATLVKSARAILVIVNKADCVYTQPGREDRLTLAHNFSGGLWLPFAFSFCFFRALRAACKCSGFTPVCKHITSGSQFCF